MAKTVVITGASSGLGRATAIVLAERGDHVVLAARRRDELEETARLCRERGGTAAVVETDVTDEQAVARLVEAAGDVDVWINNAGVTFFALLEDGPLEDHRRVIETNLVGALICARAIVPRFRARGRGTLINVGSVLSKVGQAFVPSYVMSKFGLRGMSEALSVELADHPDIHVCTLFPYAMNTPHFQSAANVTGQKPYVMPPEQTPEEVAVALADLAHRPRRERHVPRIAQLAVALHWLFPVLTDRLLIRALRRFHLAGSQAETEGGIYQPVSEPAKVHGRRPARLSTLSFLGWVLRETLRIQVERMSAWRHATS
jgi:NAD(P)-dependent dehydrogenase (short-subunit alcohol dehydrogenase family)